ncbi:MAG: T9SS type A sorting domain-containing protein, partial [Crocinitomicaceae bacterium]
AGYSHSFSGNGNFDAYLIRTDAIGNKLWEKTYGTENWEKINDAIITKDSAILMVGETQPVNGQSTEIYLVKTNFLGDTLWTKTFGSTGNDRANTVINLADSSFIIGGEMYIADSNLVKGFVLRMNRFGDIMWQDTIGNFAGEYGVNDVFLGLNKFYAVGKRKVIETNNDDYFGSFDFNGNLVFQYTLNTPKNTMIDEVAFLPGINKTVIGTRVIDAGTYQDDFDNILAYCDTYYGYYEGWNGNSCIISNEGLDKCNQILPTNDGGFVAVGFNSNTGDNITTSNGGSNIYLAKIFPNVIYPDPYAAITGVVNFGQLVISQENELSNEMIYPNPFTDEIQIQVTSTDESKVVLVNQFGQVVLSSLFIEQTTLNTQNLPCGMYFMQVNTKIYRLVK